MRESVRAHLRFATADIHEALHGAEPFARIAQGRMAWRGDTASAPYVLAPAKPIVRQIKKGALYLYDVLTPGENDQDGEVTTFASAPITCGVLTQRAHPAVLALDHVHGERRGEDDRGGDDHAEGCDTCGVHRNLPWTSATIPNMKR